jgi:hypothetical protein
VRYQNFEFNFYDLIKPNKMKNLIIFPVAILFVIMFTNSTTIKTKNIEKTSSQLCVITKIVLNKMPSLNSNGSPWDMGSGPDVYCQILSQNKVLFESGTKEDLDISTLPVSYTNKLPFTLPYLNQSYMIKFFDYENGTLLKSDTYIFGFTFNPKDYYQKSSIYLHNDSYACTLYTEWE